MRHKYILLAFVIGISGLLVSCSGGGGGKPTVCDLGLKPKISSNAPLGQNDTLILSVFGIDEPKTYTWEGPGGFVSHERSPVIPNPPKGDNQIYTLSVVTNGGCTYTATSDRILVTGPWNPCGLDSNVLKIKQVSTVSFNKVEGRSASGNYLIEADNGGLAVVDFEFPGNQPPSEGKYEIQAGTGTVAAGRARVTVNLSTQSPYTASQGTVYVALNGTSTMVSFCDIMFTSSNQGMPQAYGGANIIWVP